MPDQFRNKSKVYCEETGRVAFGVRSLLAYQRWSQLDAAADGRVDDAVEGAGVLRLAGRPTEKESNWFVGWVARYLRRWASWIAGGLVGLWACPLELD